jgi:hypothetical protein
MEWADILDKRSHTFAFDTATPPKDLLNQITDEIHNCVPVKQNEFYYSIEIFDYSDVDLRKKIYQTTRTNYHNYYRYNPQVLAPWLFVFKENMELTINDKPFQLRRNYTNMQVGMASMFIALSAVNKGLDVGFCQCVTDHNLLNKLIGNDVVLMLGVGYKSVKDNYYCLIDEIEKPIPSKTIPKPKKEEYIKWI